MKIVYFMGGLGNQLFQYAFMKYLKEQFPNEKICYTKRSYLRLHTHGYFMLRNLDFKCHNIFRKSIYSLMTDSDDLLLLKKNTLLIGYWQDSKYLKKLKSEDITKVIVNADDVKNNQYYKIIENTHNSISVHVRRGDFLSNSLYSGICTPAYYKNAIEFVRQKINNAHFFVFSDDIEWCKTNLGFEGDEYTFVSTPSYGNKSSVDMLLMGKCQHNIIANSSYSWWGQFLNKNPDKIVIAPKKWVNGSCDAFPDGRTNLNELPYIIRID